MVARAISLIYTGRHTDIARTVLGQSLLRLLQVRHLNSTHANPASSATRSDQLDVELICA